MTIVHAEVIGDPIAHSKSPLIHNFWLEKLGTPGRYTRCHVRPEGLADYLAARRGDPDWRGCNVTIPHKQAVIPMLDRIDPAAARIGAVNTIRHDPDGSLVGLNTDFAGFLEPLSSLLSEHHLFRMARVIGSGGAARAIVHALADEGFTIAMIARNTDAALALLREVDRHAEPTMVASLESWAEPGGFAWDDRSGVLDLVVNATSLGMHGCPPLAIDFSHVPPGAVVYDIVYAPLVTPLLAAAQACGHRTVDGLEMLVGQAAIAFEQFFGQAPPREQDAALRELLIA